MRTLPIGLLAAGLLGGCAPFVPFVKIDELSPNDRAAIERMPVYTASDLQGRP